MAVDHCVIHRQPETTRRHQARQHDGRRETSVQLRKCKEEQDVFAITFKLRFVG